MVRTLVGYSILAVIGVMALKLLMGILGLAFSLLSSLLWLAAIGFLIYLVLKVISPTTASKVKDAINGNGDAND
jgi:cytosine/uracil/thiamine/allantoin permease